MRFPHQFPRILAITTLCFIVLLSACGTTSGTVAINPTSLPTVTAAATATTASPPTPTPSPTPAPITSCAQVSGFGSAGAISTGSNFSEVSFPAHTVGFVQQTFEDNSYQFRIISACTSATTTSAIRSYFASGLPPTGFAQSSTFPYNGTTSSGCGDPYCWFKGTAHPSFQATRYISLESVTAVGSVVTYNLRLCITPLVFNNITIKGTYEYDFDLVDNTDVWWDQLTLTERSMAPVNGATIANIGVTNFADVTAVQLHGLSYSNTPIDGNDDSTNKLVNGDVWAVHTDGGHYVKVLVVTYGYNIVIDYVLYDYSF
ncbi:MAG: hypothetical protein ACLQUY_06330 [Ktedonobacterales bacterium]